MENIDIFKYRVGGDQDVLGCKDNVSIRLIGNCFNGPCLGNEQDIVQEFADRVNSKIIGIIPRSDLVQKSEIDAKTVLEKYPDSKQAELYRELANEIFLNEDFVIPEPMDIEEFDEFFRKYQ